MTSASDLNKLIECINDAGLDAQRMPEVLDEIAKRIGAQHVNLWIRSRRQTRSVNDWDGIESSFVRSYEDYYARVDPIVPLTSAWTPGTIFTDEMMVSRSVLDRSEFYRDWVHPQGIRGIVLANFLRDGDLTGTLGAPRGSATPYPQKSLALVRALLPHLRHAIHTQRCLGTLRISERNKADALNEFVHGILIVDRNARVTFCNRQAEFMMSASGGLRIDRHMVVAPTPSATRALHGLVLKATSDDPQQRTGGALLVERIPPLSPLKILVTALGPQSALPDGDIGRRSAMLLIVDQERTNIGPEPQLISLFGLTQAEARVAGRIGKGATIEEVADELRVHSSTVRTHLHHIFAKAGIRRQAELVRLVELVSLVDGRGLYNR